MPVKKTTSYPKEKINILFLENISEAAVKRFREAGYASVRKLGGALGEEELLKEIKDIHLLGIRSKTQITGRVLEAAKKLQAIGCFCIGVNQVDVVTLHVPDNTGTRNLVNRNRLKQFKKGAILINYARGEVVDLEALEQAIKEEQISGAAIDVYPVEPEKNGDSFVSPLQH